MESIQKEKYQCSTCNRSYKLKLNYDKHVGYCSFINKSKKEQTDILDSMEDIPKTQELFQYIKEIALRVDKLEKENAFLKSCISKEKRKIDVLEWLNQKSGIIPKNTFPQWIMSVSIEKLLKVVFENDLIQGIIQCFDNKENLDIPIYSFSHKLNKFYIYVDENKEEIEKNRKWVLFTIDMFDKWIDFIANRFLCCFEKWVNENKEIIQNNEEMNQKYLCYFQKLLGGKLSNETRNSRIRHAVYNKIVKNKSVIEYDLS